MASRKKPVAAAKKRRAASKPVAMAVKAVVTGSAATIPENGETIPQLPVKAREPAGRPTVYKALPPLPPRPPYRGPRPTGYDPAMCEQLIEIMSEGYSPTAACGAIGLSRERLRHWEKDNPELVEALAVGRAQRALFWENRGIYIAYRGAGPGTQSQVKAGQVSSSKEEWSDKPEAEKGFVFELTIIGKDVHV